MTRPVSCAKGAIPAKSEGEGVCRMSVQGMNHFTVLSDDLDVTKKFYCDLLGFAEGPRPNFQFPAYWLYVRDQPILHVIDRKQLNEVRAGGIELMACPATDL